MDDAGFLQQTLTAEQSDECEKPEDFVQKIFSRLPDNSVSWEAFQSAMQGKLYLQSQEIFSKPNIITIVDFSKPSTKERFFVIDIDRAEILFSSLTAHGQGTGDNMAQLFSNKPNSHQSSLGFYKTAEIYYGKHGKSMRLDGLEKGINDNARHRAIVVHAANYVSQSFINRHGRLGRSFGCPALPQNLNDIIINTISDGTLFYIYAPDKQYLASSKVVQSANFLATLR